MSGSSTITLKSSGDGFSFRGETVGYRSGYGAPLTNIRNTTAVNTNILSQSVSPGSIVSVDMRTDTNNVAIVVENPDQWPAYTNSVMPRFTLCMSGADFGAGPPRFLLERQGVGVFVTTVYGTGSAGLVNNATRGIRNNGDATAKYEFVAISAEDWHVTVHGVDPSQFTLS